MEEKGAYNFSLQRFGVYLKVVEEIVTFVLPTLEGFHGIKEDRISPLRPVPHRVNLQVLTP